MDGYLIKYALTDGIQGVQGAEEVAGGYVRTPGAFGFFVKMGRYFFRTPEEAEEAAKMMAARKIKSLERQLVRLRKLVVTPKWAKGCEDPGAQGR